MLFTLTEVDDIPVTRLTDEEWSLWQGCRERVPEPIYDALLSAIRGDFDKYPQVTARKFLLDDQHAVTRVSIFEALRDRSDDSNSAGIGTQALMARFVDLTLRRLAIESPYRWASVFPAADPLSLALYINKDMEAKDRCFTGPNRPVDAMTEGLNSFEASRKAILEQIHSSLPMPASQHVTKIPFLVQRCARLMWITAESMGCNETSEENLANYGSLKELFPGVPIFRGTSKTSSDILQMLIDQEWNLILGRQAVRMVEQGTERLNHLLPLLQPVQPSRKAVNFLKRVSRTFIFGFDAECIILCRSVLDVEFQSFISIDECIDSLGGRKPPNYPLADRVAAAVKLNRISAAVAAQARRVKDEANSAIHSRPDLPMNVLDILKDTLSVLQAIDSDPHPQ